MALDLAQSVGETDVDALLDTLTPQQFARWRSFFIWKHESRQRELATLLAAVHNASITVCSGFSGKIDRTAYVGPDDFLKGGKRRSRRLSAEESQRLAQARYGG